jgi:hypothetical protein
MKIGALPDYPACCSSLSMQEGARASFPSPVLSRFFCAAFLTLQMVQRNAPRTYVPTAFFVHTRYASFPAMDYFDNHSLLLSTAPISPSFDAGAVFRLINASYGGAFPSSMRNPSVLWAFRYEPNLADPSTQTLGAACYMEASTGVDAVGYVLDIGDVAVGPILWFPNSFGAGPLLGKVPSS